MIPEGIKREHILKAIEEIKNSEIPAQRDSSKYDLEYDNKLYPPKYVISLANKYANGTELDHEVFGGGPESNAFLSSLGFNIVNKETSNINTPQSKNLLSFIDLQRFLLEEMQMQANYQPIMIRTLLVSGDRATKDNIAAMIKDLNQADKERDFKNVPVYDVLEKHRIVRKEGDEFVLNSVQLTSEQRQQLIALCNWKTENLSLPLEELILAFDKNKRLFDPERLSDQERENIRLEFVSNFPVDKIQNMELDEYVIGKQNPRTGSTNKQTFSYGLEDGLPGFGGVGGSPAGKYGIFYSKKHKKYVYDESKYSSPQAAFTQIKHELQTILEAAKQFVVELNWGKLAQVIEGKFEIHRHIRSKILSVYYPNTFLQIHSVPDIKLILQTLGLKKEVERKGLKRKRKSR
jgi:hypothetical protein